MSGIMLALGDYRFSIDTAAYDGLERSHEYRWEVQERLGRKNALQFMGPGTETVSLDGTIFPYFRGGLDQLDRMRAEAAKGEPLLLVDGRGRVWGEYAIRRVDEGQRLFFDDGSPRKVTFKVGLEAYGEDLDQRRGYAVPVDILGQIETNRAKLAKARTALAARDAEAQATRDFFGLSDDDAAAAMDGAGAAGIPADERGAFVDDMLGLAARAADIAGRVLPSGVLLHSRRTSGTATLTASVLRQIAADPDGLARQFTEDPVEGMLSLGERVARTGNSRATSRRLLSGRSATRLETFSDNVNVAREAVVRSRGS